MKFLKTCLLAAVLSPWGRQIVKAEQVEWSSLRRSASSLDSQTALLCSSGTSQATSNSTLLLVHFNSPARKLLAVLFRPLLASNMPSPLTITLRSSVRVGNPARPVRSRLRHPRFRARWVISFTCGSFNSADPATATQVSDLSRIQTWVRPASGPNTVSYDISDLGTFVPTGAHRGVIREQLISSPANHSG